MRYENNEQNQLGRFGGQLGRFNNSKQLGRFDTGNRRERRKQQHELQQHRASVTYEHIHADVLYVTYVL